MNTSSLDFFQFALPPKKVSQRISCLPGDLNVCLPASSRTTIALLTFFKLFRFQRPFHLNVFLYQLISKGIDTELKMFSSTPKSGLNTFSYYLGTR